MAYTEQDFKRMETDQNLRRQYVWQVGQKALMRAAEYRRDNRWDDADLEEDFGRTVLENIDRISE